MLNLTSSDKTSEMLFRMLVQSLQTWICVHLSGYIRTFILLHRYFFSVKPVNQQRRQLAARFYSKWYCAVSGVDVLARRFRLALNWYIVCASANVKLYPYQAMISNGFLGETNEQRIFSQVFYNSLHFKFHLHNLQWKIPQWKVSYKKCIIITKPKVKILWFCMCDKLHT